MPQASRKNETDCRSFRILLYPLRARDDNLSQHKHRLARCIQSDCCSRPLKAIDMEVEENHQSGDSEGRSATHFVPYVFRPTLAHQGKCLDSRAGLALPHKFLNAEQTSRTDSL